MEKTFKYRISDKEGVHVGTHNEEDFPLESMRLEWAYTLLFQKAIIGILQRGMRIIVDRKLNLTSEEKNQQERIKFLCDSFKTSNEFEWIEITCTEEEIDLIEECAHEQWERTLNAYIDLKDVVFPNGLEKMKDKLTNPNDEHNKYQMKMFEMFKNVIATRHT